MQINKISNIQNHNNYATKVEKETTKFKDALAMEDKNKQVQYDSLKIIKNGELYGLVNGSWQKTNADFSDMKCGPNEILVIGEDFVKVGVDIVKNFGMFGIMNKTPFSIQEDLGFSDMINGIALVPGKTVNLADGTILKWTRNGVDFIPRKTGNLNESAIAYKYASEMAFTMNQFTRVANKEAFGVGKVIGITKEKTNQISKVLNAMGIDTSNEFYVNGKKFMFDTTSGEFKYTFEGSANGKYNVRYVKGSQIRLSNTF